MPGRNKRTFFQWLIHKWDAKILSLILAIICVSLYRINSLDRRNFNIPLHVKMNESFVASGTIPQKVSVSIRGQEDLIYSIMDEDLEAYIDFSSYKTEGEFKEPVRLVRKGAALDDSIEIRIDPVELTLKQEQKLTRSIVISPVISGFPASGYELTHYFMSPSSVTVVGPRSIVEGLQTIKTEEIDISGQFEDFIVSARLVKPDNSVYIPGGEVVEFHGIIVESIVVEKYSDLSLVVIDLPETLEIISPIPQASITVQGRQLLLSGISRDQFNFMIDCSGISVPGEYSLPVMVNIPEDLTVLDYYPKEAVIIVGKKTEEGL